MGFSSVDVRLASWVVTKWSKLTLASFTTHLTAKTPIRMINSLRIAPDDSHQSQFRRCYPKFRRKSHAPTKILINRVMRPKSHAPKMRDATTLHHRLSTPVLRRLYRRHEPNVQLQCADATWPMGINVLHAWQECLIAM